MKDKITTEGLQHLLNRRIDEIERGNDLPELMWITKRQALKMLEGRQFENKELQQLLEDPSVPDHALLEVSRERARSVE